MEFSFPESALKLIGMSLLCMFLPLTAATYHFFRRRRRKVEINRIFKILKIDEKQKKAYEDEKPGPYLLWAVAYITVVSFVGLMLIFMSSEFKIDEFPIVKIGALEFPAKGSRLVFGMAFLGAYMWGLHHVIRRFFVNDLFPGVYYRLSYRMGLAAITAMVVFNAYHAIRGCDGSDIVWYSNIWPALAFMIGMFPRRALHWMTSRLPIVSPESPLVPHAPLDMIEGITIHDKMRLEELEIDTCYDLATYDFVPLILKTPYSARELVSWILQAKLCVHFGEAVRELRQHGIRKIIDIEDLNTDDFNKLTSETSVTMSAFKNAQKAIEEDKEEIDRLHKAEHELSKFWEEKEQSE
jgi:hypothetical protein